MSLIDPQWQLRLEAVDRALELLRLEPPVAGRVPYTVESLVASAAKTESYLRDGEQK